MLLEGIKYILLSKKGLENVPIETTINNFNINIKIFQQKIKSIENITQDDIDMIDEFATSINTISSFAPHYDYKQDLPHNGYRSFVKIWTQVIQNMNSVDDDNHTKQFISAINGMKNIFEFPLEYHSKNYANIYPVEDGKRCMRKLNAMFQDEGKNWRIFNTDPVNFPQLVPKLRICADFLRRYGVMNIKSLDIFKKARAYFDQKYMMKKLAECQSKLTIDQIAHAARIFCARAHYLQNILFRVESYFDTNTLSISTISTKISSKYVIDMNDPMNIKISEADIDIASKYRTINSQIVRYEISKESDIEASVSDRMHRNKLVIFLHGGGFIAPKAEDCFHVYVTPWAKTIPGLTIINFDYSLSPENRFPTQIQELIDFYMFLRGYQISSDKVIDLLGYFPDDIILVGDSAGAHMALMATIALNDINHLFDQNIKLPKSLVLFYPKVNMNYHSYPSILNSIWDLIVTPQLCPSFAQAYVPLIKLAKDEEAKQDANHNYDKKSDDKTRLFTIEEQISMPSLAIFDEDKTIISTVYSNGFAYEKYEQLSNISLKLLSFEFDPLLDESILLAKKWKGKVDIKVFPNLCHAAIIFRQFCKEAKEAYDEGTRMIIEAINE